MDFLDLVNYRQSVRRYGSQRVEKDKLERCLEAARLAPSASNSQPWTFVVVDDQELKDRVARQTFDNIMSFNKFVSQAPVIIVVVIEKPKIITHIGSKIKNLDYPLIDIGISSEHFCLQAATEGLGTCMIGWFNEKPIKTLLNIPKNKKIGLLITLGYPADNYKQREKVRKGFEKMVRFNSYQ